MKPKRTVFKSCLLFAAMLQVITNGAQTVTNVAGGYYHSLFLKSDGSLWAMGYNYYGGLGDGTTNNINFPEQIVASNVTAIAPGAEHSLFLKGDGSLWAMGWNQYGELGDSTFNNANQPKQIVTSGVKAIAAGGEHSLFLKNDGSLWAMGRNNYGQLGDGTFNNTNQPKQIVASGVTAIAAGLYHTLFLKSDGSLWAMGWNSLGGLGDGTYNHTNRPKQMVVGGVTAIAAGLYHTLFLKSGGSLWAVGNNFEGELGDGTFNTTNRPEQIVTSGVTTIGAGGSHSLFLKSDGSLWGMGNNQNGQLGDGRNGSRTNRPEQILASGVMAVAGGAEHSLFLKSDGSMWAMGYNYYGQLGDGSNFDTNRPKQIVAGPSSSPSITSKPAAAIAIAAGGTTNLSVSVLPSSVFSSQWFFNGTGITGATGTNLTISNFDLTKAGIYSIVVSNQNGSDIAFTVLRLTNSPVVLVDGVDVGGGSVSRIASAQISMSSTFGGNAHIYYTHDGSTPSFLSIPYNGPFQLTQTATIRALAYDSAYVSSAEAAPITVEVVPIYRLISSTPGGGSTAFSPAAYSGGDYFISNTAVTITATPSSGWSFLGWLGDAAGPNPMATLTMTRDMAVQALFGTAVTSNALGAGQIWFGRQVSLYPYGTTLAVAAMPQTGSYLINWAGALSGSNNPNALVVTTPNPIITALFGSLSAGRYALTVLPQGAGSVTVSPYTNRYASGTVVTVTAVPGSGQTFTGWSGDASGAQNPLTVTMTQSKVIAASFTSRPTLSTAPPLNRMAEQGFRFSLIGELGIACRMDGSSNLSSWVPLGWLTNDFGTSQFLDPAALTNAAQFYRAVTQ